jgi:hypothetical protein
VTISSRTTPRATTHGHQRIDAASLAPSAGAHDAKELPMVSSRTFFATFSVVALTTSLVSVAGCSSGDIAVGSTEQALQKTKNGAPTGNGQTCSWDDTVSHDATTGATTTTPAPNGPYKIGDTFKSSDGCNDCSCTAQGIACTLRACAPGGGGTCSYNGKSYTAGAGFASSDGCNSCSCQADGSVACTEKACAPVACTEDAKQCPDGSYVSRSGPACEFAPCPGDQACTTEAKQCPDGSYVGRTGPNCAFALCP